MTFGHRYRSSGQQPSTYTDLTNSDIAALAEIVSHAPAYPNSSSATAAYRSIVRDLISNLPSHLCAKVPWISPLCSLHSKIIPFPLRSILHAFQHEIDVCTPRVWRPLRDAGMLNGEQEDFLAALEDLSALWLSPADFQAKYLRQQRAKPRHVFAATKCAGCTLARMGGKFKEMIALGAFFIGRTDPGIWKKSRRILWVEAWIRNAVDEAEQEDAVMKMWEVGSDLRKMRKERGGSGRTYIDAYVADARAGSKRQHVENSGECGKLSLDEDVTADALFGDQGNPFDADDDEEEDGVVQSAAAFGAKLYEDARLPHAASSIYSCQPDEMDRRRRSDGRTRGVCCDVDSERRRM